MSADRNFYGKKELNELVRNKKYEEAMARCEEILRSGDINPSDGCRMRAYILSHQGLHDEALKERISALKLGGGDSRDYYQIGFSLLSMQRFSDASEWLEVSISAGKDEGNDWFESASCLLISFSKLQTGDPEAARTWLERTMAIDRDCSMPVPGYGLVTASDIQKKLG